MSKEAVESVIGRALFNAEFREQLLVEPDQALAEFKLTRQEKAGIRRIDAETLDSLVKIFHEHMNKFHLF